MPILKNYLFLPSYNPINLDEVEECFASISNDRRHEITVEMTNTHYVYIRFDDIAQRDLYLEMIRFYLKDRSLIRYNNIPSTDPVATIICDKSLNKLISTNNKNSRLSLNKITSYTPTRFGNDYYISFNLENESQEIPWARRSNWCYESMEARDADLQLLDKILPLG